ncbi:YdcF family protein [Treponema sp.]|uniref:YdcF family protein n=1 Tax=Treponema sp. TaxID=166 RepID=UPI003F06C6E8
MALKFAPPESFIDSITVIDFSIVWLLVSAFFIMLAVLSRKKLLRKKWENIPRALRIFFCIALSAGALTATATLFFICTPRLAAGTENVRYVIVLGGGITKNKKLTDSVQNRIRTASVYIKSQPQAISIVSGGKGIFSPCPESDVLKPALAAYGISEDKILAEDQAKDTIQNLIFSAELISRHEGISVEEVLSSPVAIVTSDFHLARAERLAARIGFTDIYGVASKTPALFILNSYCREICSYLKLNLRIIFTGKPSRLS